MLSGSQAYPIESSPSRNTMKTIWNDAYLDKMRKIGDPETDKIVKDLIPERAGISRPSHEYIGAQRNSAS